MSKQTQTVLGMTLIWLSHFFLDMMIGIWPIYKTMIHLDVFIASLIATTCEFFGEGMQMVFGLYADRGYRQRFIILGLLLSAAALFITFTQNPLLLFFIILGISFGSGAFHPSAVGFVGNLSGKNKGLALTVYTSGGALGMALSQIIFTSLHNYFSGHILVLAPLVLLLLVFLIRIPFPQAPLKKNSPSGFKAFTAIFKKHKKEMSLLFCIQICMLSMYWSTIFFLPDILALKECSHWLCYGGGHFAFIAGSALIMVPAGYLSDKYCQRSLIFAAVFGSALTYYTFLHTTALPSTITFCLLILLGGCNGLINPIVIAFGAKLAPEQAGTMSGFLSGLALCLASLSYSLIGLLFHFFENNPLINALSCAGLLFFVAMGLILYLPRLEELYSPTQSEQEQLQAIEA